MRIQISNDNTARLEKEVRTYKPLTAEQNIDLLRQYNQSGDTKLREAIYKGNARLIFIVANQYVGLYELPKEELFSVGSIGMLKAIDNFNPNAGYQFSSYAKMCIVNEYIKEAKRNGSLIRIKSTTSIKDHQEKQYQFLSTNTNIGDDSTLEDVIPNDDILFDELIDAIPHSDKVKEFWRIVKESGLKDSYYDIVKAIYSANTETGAPIKVTGQDVAEMFGYTKQNVQHKKNLSFKKLRKNPKLLELWKNNGMSYE